MLDCLAAIEAPVLRILAESGTLIRRPYLEPRCRPIRRLEVVKLPGGHHLHLDSPDGVAGPIAAFLSGRERPNLPESDCPDPGNVAELNVIAACELRSLFESEPHPMARHGDSDPSCRRTLLTAIHAGPPRRRLKCEKAAAATREGRAEADPPPKGIDNLH